MSRDKQIDRKAAASGKDPALDAPKGALAVTVIYLITIIVLWSYMYLTLIERGITQ